MVNDIVNTARSIPAHIVMIPWYSLLSVRYLTVNIPETVRIKAPTRIRGVTMMSKYCDKMTPGNTRQRMEAGMIIRKLVHLGAPSFESHNTERYTKNGNVGSM